MKNTIRALVGALALTIALVGCAHTPQTAVQVNGHEIGVDEVEAVASDYAALVGQPVNDLRYAVAGQLLRGEVARDIMAAEGVEIPEDQRQAALAALNPNGLAFTEPVQRLADDIIDFRWLTAEVPIETINAAVAQMDITVNPRYGSFEPNRVLLDPLGGSLSAPSEGAEPGQK